VRGQDWGHDLTNQTTRTPRLNLCHAKNKTQDRSVSGYTASRIPECPTKHEEPRDFAFSNPGSQQHSLHCGRPPQEIGPVPTEVKSSESLTAVRIRASYGWTPTREKKPHGRPAISDSLEH
jgi:hypothetical protein